MLKGGEGGCSERVKILVEAAWVAEAAPEKFAFWLHVFYQCHTEGLGEWCFFLR